MNIGDLVKAVGRNTQDYGIIIDIVESGRMIAYVKVFLFNGKEENFHPTRITVLPEQKTRTRSK